MSRKLMVYDRTCTRAGRLPLGLTHSWMLGARLYGALGRLDGWHGVSSWEEALSWLVAQDGPIDEVQFWGHGNWGLARIDHQPLDVSALQPGHRLHSGLVGVRERMAPRGRWWFRTCDTLGSARGHDFARRWTDFFGGPVAGHTHVIGPWQSGLHQLEPGATPHWSDLEGVAAGTAERPTGSTWSRPTLPHTIHCLQGEVPEGW